MDDIEIKKPTSENTIQLIKAEVLPRLVEMQGKMDVTNTKLEAIDKRLCETDGIVKMLRVTLYGNGDPQKSITAEVARLKEWAAEKKDNNNWLIRVIGGAVLLEGIALIKLIFGG